MDEMDVMTDEMTDSMADKIPPRVSVVIPALNEGERVKKCLDSLLALNYKKERLEIIIIDDGSTDGSTELIKRYSKKHGLTYLRTERLGPSRARNLGVRHASGEFIAFTDADCIVDSEWINELLKGFFDENTAGVGGSQKSPLDETDFGKDVQRVFELLGFAGEYIKTGTNIQETEHNPTCNVMYRKKVFDEVGGFVSDIWPGEDVELDYRIKKQGYCLVFNPGALVYHYRPGTMKQFRKMMRSYGRVQANLLRRYGFFRKLHYEPFILITGILIYAAVAVFSPILAVAIGVSGILALIAGPLIKFKSRGLRISVLLIAVIFEWNLGFVRGFLEY